MEVWRTIAFLHDEPARTEDGDINDGFTWNG
jgi:hypothetical protein